MKTNYQSIAAIVLLALCAFSCSKDEKKNEAKTSKVQTCKELDATSFTKWVYFSFKTGKAVELSDEAAAKDLSWDVAFHRQDIRVNGKEGFSGQAAVAMTRETNFDAVTKDTPHSPFFGNEKRKVVVGVNHPPRTEEEMLRAGEDPYTYAEQFAVNSAVNTYSINMDKMREGAAAMYPVNKNVMILKSADGQMFKLQVTASVNSMGKKGGTLTFDYVML